MKLLLGVEIRITEIVWVMLAVYVLQFAGCSEKAPEDISQQPYISDWESLERHRTPEWLMDAKFGLYIHWGVYSVPAYDEQYSRNMYLPGTEEKRYQIETYGPLYTFGYKDFIPYFEAESFEPDEWAALFVESGAKFAGPVAEYRDGFALWNSDVSVWNAVNMGPCRDVVGELEQAIRSHGLKFMIAFSHQWHWGWYPTYDTETDTCDPAYEGLYGPVLAPDASKYTNPDPQPTESFQKDWLARVEEVTDGYHPDFLYFGGRMGIIGEQYRQAMLSHYYNAARATGQDVVAAYATEKLERDLELFHCGVEETDDFNVIESSVMYGSYSYQWEARYKTSDALITELIDAVSKNGVYLLSVPPREDGVIPPEVRVRLQTIGEWLNMNGEAIYGTRPWEIYGELPGSAVSLEGNLRSVHNPLNQSIRFTQSADGGCLYAMFLDWPGNSALISSLDPDTTKDIGSIASISMIGSDQQLSWSQDADGVMVQMPDMEPSERAFVLKIVWTNNN